MCEMENQSHIYANITWMNLIAAELIRVWTELEHLWFINKRVSQNQFILVSIL